MNLQIEKLDKLVDELMEKINQEAVEYRKSIIIPFCNDYKLAYSQCRAPLCMERFFFYDKEWLNATYVRGINCGPEFDEFLNLGKSSRLLKSSHFVSRLREIIAVLNHETINNDCFGLFICYYSGIT